MNKRVSAQAIGKYERGEMQPTPEVLDLLAAALGVQKGYLLSPATIELGTIEFRENKIRNKTDEKIVESTITQHLTHYAEIEELLSISATDWDKPRQYPFPVKDLHDAEAAAQRVRADWGLGSDPIPNLSEFLEERGFKVISSNMPATIAGVTCFVKSNASKIPVIVTSEEITGERQRFTLAHELAHLLLDFGKSISAEVEKACDKFAGAFLMPERILWEGLGKVRKTVGIGELLALKAVLGVSVQALTFRAKDLGIINQYTYRSLYAEFAKRGWLKPPYNEPNLLNLETTQRFKRLCLRALAEGIINKRKASELLNIPVDAVEVMFNGLES
jgi:Zn-dependent peptidase ImmA (M78 family)